MSSLNERILFAAGQHPTVKVGALATAFVAALAGGRKISAADAPQLITAMESAFDVYTLDNDHSQKLPRNEGYAEMLGVRATFVRLNKTRTNVTESIFTYGPDDGAPLRIIEVSAVTDSKIEYYTVVGDNLIQDLTPNEKKIVLSMLHRNPYNFSAFVSDTTKLAAAVQFTMSNSNSASNSASNNDGDEGDQPHTPVPNRTNEDTITKLRREVEQLTRRLNNNPGTPSSSGGGGASATSSNFLPAYSSKDIVYLKHFRSDSFREFRLAMTNMSWPKHVSTYVHEDIRHLVEYEWDNKRDEDNLMEVPCFGDSYTMEQNSWLEMLESVIRDKKDDETGVAFPKLTVSMSNGLPMFIDDFMSKLATYVAKNSVAKSPSALKNDIIQGIAHCAVAHLAIVKINKKLASEDPKYAVRKLLSRLHDLLNALAIAGSAVNAFQSSKNGNPKGGTPKGKGTFGKSNTTTTPKANTNNNNTPSNTNPTGVTTPKVEEDKQVDFVCHDCGLPGHRRGHTSCKHYDPAKKRKANDTSTPTDSKKGKGSNTNPGK